MYQFIRGLHDVSAQEHILETTAQVEGGELSVIRVLKIAEAYEMGKQSQKLVNNGGQISRLSDYQAGKRTSRQESRNTNNTNIKKAQDSKQCGNCGKSDHTSKLYYHRKSLLILLHS